MVFKNSVLVLTLAVCCCLVLVSSDILLRAVLVVGRQGLGHTLRKNNYIPYLSL